MEKMRENCHQTYFDENQHAKNILKCKRNFFGEPDGWDKIPTFSETLRWKTALSLGSYSLNIIIVSKLYEAESEINHLLSERSSQSEN